MCKYILCTTSVNCFLLSSASTADVSQVWPGMDQSFTKEVEDEANSYFQRIYNHPPNPTISIDEVLEMLKKFKDSPVKKERVSTCKCNIQWKKLGFWFCIKAKDCTVCIVQYFISNSRNMSTFYLLMIFVFTTSPSSPHFALFVLRGPGKGG